jgi:hypothetical protein
LQRALKTALAFSTLGSLELRVELIDRIVGEMLKVRAKIALLRCLIAFSCKPAKPVIEDIDSQWIDTAYENINPHVELIAINKKRIWHVSLNDTMLSYLNFYVRIAIHSSRFTK